MQGLRSASGITKFQVCLTTLRKKLRTLAGKHPKQRPDCYILNLPDEILAIIVNHLSAYARAIVSLTCSAFRNFVRMYSSIRFTRTQYLLYLYALGRPNPDVYVCDECCRFHQVCEDDTPFLPFSSLEQDCEKDIRTACTSRPLWPEHRHLQLAFKYARLQKNNSLEPSYNSHLQELLRPYYGIQINSNTPGLTTTITVWAAPRIIGGKYLMKYMWQYENSTSLELEEADRPFVTTGLIICEHQTIPNANDFEPWILRARNERTFWNMNYPKHIPYRPFELDNAAHKAFNGGAGNPEVVGSCPHCPTDFAVEACAGRARVTAWYDFGAEGSHWVPEWRVLDFGRVGKGAWAKGHLQYKSQNIRQRYEQDVEWYTAQ
jgi:hypothetical protein